MHTDSVLIPDHLFHDARNGDSEALSALWDVCAPIVKPVVHRYEAAARPTVEAADVAQEAARVFLETVRSDVCPSGAHFVQQLARILPHRLFSYLRAERRRLGRQVLLEQPAVERALQRGKSRGSASGPPGRQVARAIERLSPRQRAVIAGLYFHDDDVRTLARQLGVSHQAVSNLHRRALTALRDALASPDS